VPDVDHHESQVGRPGQLGGAGERVSAAVGVIHTDDERSRHGELHCWRTSGKSAAIQVILNILTVDSLMSMVKR